MEEIQWKAWVFSVVCGEPAVVVLGFEDEGQMIVDGGDELVGLGGDQGKALQPVAERILPTVQRPAKAKGRSSAMDMAKTLLMGPEASLRLTGCTCTSNRLPDPPFGVSTAVVG